jgi:hypothetical protein
MEAPKEILNDIADSMEAGNKCFIHRETFEVVRYPRDLDEFAGFDDAAWKEEKNKVKKNKKKFLEIEDMDSRHKFRVMAAFAESLEESHTKIRLITSLEGHKPFANFKHQIHSACEYREQEQWELAD